jgi:hypothetical protein
MIIITTAPYPCYISCNQGNLLLNLLKKIFYGLIFMIIYTHTHMHAHIQTHIHTHKLVCKICCIVNVVCKKENRRTPAVSHLKFISPVKIPTKILYVFLISIPAHVYCIILNVQHESLSTSSLQNTPNCPTYLHL